MADKMRLHSCSGAPKSWDVCAGVKQSSGISVNSRRSRFAKPLRKLESRRSERIAIMFCIPCPEHDTPPLSWTCALEHRRGAYAQFERFRGRTACLASNGGAASTTITTTFDAIAFSTADSRRHCASMRSTRASRSSASSGNPECSLAARSPWCHLCDSTWCDWETTMSAFCEAPPTNGNKTVGSVAF